MSVLSLHIYLRIYACLYYAFSCVFAHPQPYYDCRREWPTLIIDHILTARSVRRRASIFESHPPSLIYIFAHPPPYYDCRREWPTRPRVLLASGCPRPPIRCALRAGSPRPHVSRRITRAPCLDPGDVEYGRGTHESRSPGA
ncbi:hypothetical protein RSAG8_12619, partial [Rhizoctonia solani AG-8 WAC10335]